MKHSHITIQFPDGRTDEIEHGTKAGALLEELSSEPENVLAVKINNKIYSLDKKIKYDSKIQPVMMDSKEGANVYRRSLCLLLAAASHSLYPETRLLVGHSLDYGYYYTLENGKEIEESAVSAIESKMRSMVQENIPIETNCISYEQALTVFEKSGQIKTRDQLEFVCPPRVKVNTIKDYCDLYFGPLAPATGMLKTFDLMKYEQGFLLRFPSTTNPYELKEFCDQPKLFEIYSKYKTWGKRLGVTAVADLNRLIVERKINDFIDITETLQEKCIADIADQIAEKKKARVVLIAGPSSSGKTTTSKKLALELQAMGYVPKIIGLDCFYVGHDRNPVDENGNLDFECLEALDIQLLNEELVDLLDGKEVIIPTYNFMTGVQSFEKKNTLKLAENEILIMEGIHGLNPKLTPKIPEDMKFKIYLSALTQLNLDDHNRISTSNNRLIRRIVRDYQFRGKSAAGTIAMWPSVRNGEEKHIFPFQNNADAILNTALDYELSVLKIYAEPLLRCVKPTESEYVDACTLLSFLDNFATIDPTAVPPRSIIREFIGGSAFKY